MPGDRTEQATQHRREKARREGDILHSRELTASAGMLAGVIVLGLVISRVVEAWRASFAGFLSLGTSTHWEQSTLQPTLVELRRLAISVLLPAAAVMAAVAGAALVVGVVQTGGVNVYGAANRFSTSPKYLRSSPYSFLRRHFGINTT
jgi:flagellar biosynthesis protein FlhB